MNEKQLQKCLEHSTASFPAWCSMTVDERETVKLFSLSVANSRSLWVSKTTYSLFLSPTLSVSFLYCTTLSYHICQRQQKSHCCTKTAEVSNRSGFCLLNLSTTMKFNHPPARLITRWEDLLWPRFITGESVYLWFFYFTARYYW